MKKNSELYVIAKIWVCSILQQHNDSLDGLATNLNDTIKHSSPKPNFFTNAYPLCVVACPCFRSVHEYPSWRYQARSAQCRHGLFGRHGGARCAHSHQPRWPWRRLWQALVHTLACQHRQLVPDKKNVRITARHAMRLYLHSPQCSAVMPNRYQAKRSSVWTTRPSTNERAYIFSVYINASLLEHKQQVFHVALRSEPHEFCGSR